MQPGSSQNFLPSQFSLPLYGHGFSKEIFVKWSWPSIQLINNCSHDPIILELPHTFICLFLKNLCRTAFHCQHTCRWSELDLRSPSGWTYSSMNNNLRDTWRIPSWVGEKLGKILTCVSGIVWNVFLANLCQTVSSDMWPELLNMIISPFIS